MAVHTGMYWYVLPCTCTVQSGTRYKMVQDGTRWYKQWYMEVHGGTRPYENRLNSTGWYVLACTDPYNSIWVCCPAAGFAAASNHTNASSRMFQSTAAGPASNSVTSPALIGGGRRQRRFFGGRGRFRRRGRRRCRDGSGSVGRGSMALALASSEGTGMGPRVGRAHKQSG
jgi:hypothetical protein